jgi:large subunit ribosomal protein L6
MLFLNVPKNIDIKIGKNWIKIIGPLGSIIKKKSKNIKIYYNKDENKLYLLNENKKNDFYLSLINKLIWGLYKGYTVKLQVIGVGYKASLSEDKLILRLGYSHDVIYNIPKDVKVTISQQKILTLILFGTNLQRVKQVASEIRSLKSPEPYKGKGIRFFNEIIRQKEGKKN